MEEAIDLSSMPTDNSIMASQLTDELRLEHESLRTVSEETGGFAVLNQNDFRNAFARILDDNSSYYVLGYYPTNDKRDGRFRNIQVRVVGKPGLRVRTRRVCRAAAGGQEKDRGDQRTQAERTSPELLGALESPGRSAA